MTDLNLAEIHYKEFVRSQELITKEHQNLDNLVFIVSTGALALSVSYITGLKNTYLYWPVLLLCTWIALGLAVVFQAIGYKLSIRCQERNLSKLIEWGEKFFDVNDPENIKFKAWLNTRFKIVKFFDWLALTLFITGLACLTIFAVHNFIEKNNAIKAETNKAIQQQEQAQQWREQVRGKIKNGTASYGEKFWYDLVPQE